MGRVAQLTDHEKDFLLRSELKYSTEHATALSGLKREISSIQKMVEQQPVLRDKVNLLMPALQEYQDAFAAVVRWREAIGLATRLMA